MLRNSFRLSLLETNTGISWDQTLSHQLQGTGSIDRAMSNCLWPNGMYWRCILKQHSTLILPEIIFWYFRLCCIFFWPIRFRLHCSGMGCLHVLLLIFISFIFLSLYSCIFFSSFIGVTLLLTSLPGLFSERLRNLSGPSCKRQITRDTQDWSLT